MVDISYAEIQNTLKGQSMKIIKGHVIDPLIDRNIDFFLYYAYISGFLRQT